MFSISSRLKGGWIHHVDVLDPLLCAHHTWSARYCTVHSFFLLLLHFPLWIFQHVYIYIYFFFHWNVLAPQCCFIICIMKLLLTLYYNPSDGDGFQTTWFYESTTVYPGMNTNIKYLMSSYVCMFGSWDHYFQIALANSLHKKKQ